MQKAKVAKTGGIMVDALVELYNMKPHPEGGFYAETYRSSGKIMDGTEQHKYKGERSYSTGIYYLLPNGARSKLHRIASDEMWHFYLGGPMTIVELTPKGELMETVLGPDVLNGQKVQHVVPAGNWFGGFPLDDTDFSFVGCTVAPGFDFADFEFGNIEALLKEYPKAKPLIERLLS
jgi:predicted cupin superfamily sugar epimerase